MRILAVDPGEKRIGIAVSDSTGMIARPLTVLNHISRVENAKRIIHLAQEQGAERIVIGQSLDDNGEPSLQGRHALHLGEAIQNLASIPVEYWDESFSTQDAQSIRREMGVTRKKRSGHLDDVAAAVVLQSYLDSKRP